MFNLIFLFMNTTKENNIRVSLIWVGFLLITIGLGVNMAFCMDAGETWRTVLGIIAFIVLIVGTVRYGWWVRAHYVELDSKAALEEAKKAEAEVKTTAKKK